MQNVDQRPTPIAGNGDQRPAPKLGDFVLYAQRRIILAADEKIDGNVGVHAAALGVSGGQLHVGNGSHITKLLISPSVDLGNSVTFGGVLTNQLVQMGSPAVAQPFPAAAMPALPFLRLPAAAGNQSVNVPAGNAVTLGPGNYGALTVAKSGLLRLQPGEFVFSQVTLEQSARVIAEVGPGPNPARVLIRVLGKLTATGDAQIHPVNPQNAPATAEHLTIFVYGSDDRTDRGLGPDKAGVYFGPRSNITALLVAPRGTLLVDHDVRATGAFMAFDISVMENAAIGFQDGFPDAWAGQFGSQKLQGYLPSNPDTWPVVGSVPLGTQMKLSIGLPVRTPQGFPPLKEFIKQVSDPKQPATFRHFLTQADFKARYGATDADYAALRNWATAGNSFIVKSYSNNLLLSVSGTAAQFEKALNVYLLFRQRADGTSFVSVDRNPSLDLAVPVLQIGGLTSFITPQPNAVNGTGVSGKSYRAADLRAAYLGGLNPTCSSLTGVGQVVGLVEFDIPSATDVQFYDTLNGISSLSQPTIAATEGGNPAKGSQSEATLDVVMVQAMAPLAQILVFQGSSGISLHLDDIYHAMATSSPPLTVASSSLVFKESGNVQQALAQMAAQGVSFFQSSGDYGDIGDSQDNTRMDNQTVVGGTFLSTNPLTASVPPYPNNYYASETAWNRNQPQQKDATGGGIMDGNVKKGVCFFCAGQVDIPDYQIATQQKMAGSNKGSTTARNYPDVAMVADNIEIFSGGQTVIGGGTSAAAPLWAGFAALANQQQSIVTGGTGTTMGFLNPTLYDIGQTSGTADDLYALTFNDVKDGSTNANGFGPGFSAVPGYDLVAGWGTPTCNLLNQLASPTPLTNTTPLVLLEFIIGTGGDNLEPYSELRADIVLPDGITKLSTTLHPQNSGEWKNWDGDNGGNPRVIGSISVPFPGPQVTMQSPISSVTMTLVQHFSISPDNWDMTSLTVNAYLPGSPHVCQIKLNGNFTLDDGSTGLFRFKENFDPDCSTGLCGPSQTTFAGGCP